MEMTESCRSSFVVILRNMSQIIVNFTVIRGVELQNFHFFNCHWSHFHFCREIQPGLSCIFGKLLCEGWSCLCCIVRTIGLIVRQSLVSNSHDHVISSDFRCEIWILSPNIGMHSQFQTGICLGTHFTRLSCLCLWSICQYVGNDMVSCLRASKNLWWSLSWKLRSSHLQDSNVITN